MNAGNHATSLESARMSAFPARIALSPVARSGNHASTLALTSVMPPFLAKRISLVSPRRSPPALASTASRKFDAWLRSLTPGLPENRR